MRMNRSRCTPAKFHTTSGCSRVVRKPWNKQEGPPLLPSWSLAAAAAADVALATSVTMEDRKRDGDEKARKSRERAELKAPRWNRNIVFGLEI